MAAARFSAARPTHLVGLATIAGGAVAVAIAILGPATAASATPPGDGGGDKVWVCKYTETPGGAEELKNGNDGLVDVSASTLKGQPVVVGASFSDDQGRSLVVKIGGDRPSPTVCPGYVPPTPDPTTTAPTPDPTTTTPAPDPTTTTPAPDPTTTTPAPDPTTTTPAPDPTTTTPAPDPITTTPAPDPTTTTPAPDPTTTTPAPDPTTTTPAPDPTTTTPAPTAPAPDPTTTTKTVTAVLADNSAVNPPDATAVLASTGSGDVEPLLLVGLGAIALGGIVLMESRRSTRRARG